VKRWTRLWRADRRAGQPSSASADRFEPRPDTSGEPAGPGAARATVVVLALAAIAWLLAQHGRGNDGADEAVTALGRVEVTAKLIECPAEFPDLGAYRYTYVVKYEVVKIHRQDPAGNYVLSVGDRICVGHYKPRLPRYRIQDADWGNKPLGGKLAQIVQGDVHRMALDYELANLAPSGALDYCSPRELHRFFAVWTNPVSSHNGAR